MSNWCQNCGSPILFGGPRCCDGGEAKRAQARADSLATRLALIESRLEALEAAVSGRVVWWAADSTDVRMGPFQTQAQAWSSLRWGSPVVRRVHLPGAYVWCEVAEKP